MWSSPQSLRPVWTECKQSLYGTRFLWDSTYVLQWSEDDCGGQNSSITHKYYNWLSTASFNNSYSYKEHHKVFLTLIKGLVYSNIKILYFFTHLHDILHVLTSQHLHNTKNIFLLISDSFPGLFIDIYVKVQKSTKVPSDHNDSTEIFWSDLDP